MKDLAFDPGWVAAAKAGDQEAIANLYRVSYQNVYLTIKSMLKTDEDTALDLLQDTFLKAFQRLESLEDPGKFNAWVKSIARNTALDYTRKTRMVLFSELSADDGDALSIEPEDDHAEHLPEVVIDRQETARLLREIFDSLPPGQRMIASLHYYQEMTAKEIADLLDKPIGTVKSQLSTAREKIIRKVLELEKKEGVKLHSLAPLPFFLLLIRSANTIKLEADMAVLGGILGSSGVAAGTAAAGSAAAASTGVAATVTSAAAVFTAALQSAAVKIVAGVLASALLAGGVVAANQKAKEIPEPTETYMAEALPTVDLFEDFNVAFSGSNGFGVASVISINGYSLDYRLSQGTYLSNGDSVVLTLSPPSGGDLMEYCATIYGFLPTAVSQTYIVSGLRE